MDRSTHSWFWPKVIIVLSAAAVMMINIRGPLRGDYYFRQAHVVANIEKYLEHGLSLKPETYNVDIPLSLFDFPAYQLLVAGLCQILGTEVLATARFVSILLFLLCLLAIDLVLTECAVSPLAVLLTELIFCFAPLTLFNFASPMVDGLALSLSYASLYGFLRWDRAQGAQRSFWWLAMLTAGVLSTLTKNPVYLPVCVAIAVHILTRRGPKAVVRPAFIAYLGLIAGSVVLFKGYSNLVNQLPDFLTDQESREYFGAIRDRWDLLSWTRVLNFTWKQVLNPLTFVFSLLGVGFYAARHSESNKALFLGLLGGALLEELVFFNRYTWHAYYQLPLVFPLSFFAAHAGCQLYAWGKTEGPRWRRWSRPLRIAPLLIASATLVWAVVDLPEHTRSIEWIEANGRWIQEHTDPNDFVVYLLDTDDPTDWNPVFLYFARRNGYNLTRRRFSRHPEILRTIQAQWAPATGRILVFCPAPLVSILAEKIEESSLRLVEAGPQGRLYRLEPPAMLPRSPGNESPR